MPEDRVPVPSYQPVLLTYLDFLGFREMVESSKNDPTKVPKIHKLLGGLRHQYSRMGRIEMEEKAPDNF